MADANSTGRNAQSANLRDIPKFTIPDNAQSQKATGIINEDCTKSDDQAFIEGARQALATLRNIEAWGDAQGSEETFEKYHASLDALIDAAMAPLEGLPPKQRGYVRVLVEALEFHYRTGIPNLDRWVPDAMMTAEELAKERSEERRAWED